MRKFNAHEVRLSRTDCENITLDNGGWHYSYFGDERYIREKIESFSHSEYNYDVYKNNISKNITDMRDLFGRDGVALRSVPIDLDNHPKYVVDNISSELIRKFL